MSRYPYIRAYGLMIGNEPYFIEDQIKWAMQDGAPPDAMYYSVMGFRWVTFTEIPSLHIKRNIDQIVSGFKIPV